MRIGAREVGGHRSYGEMCVSGRGASVWVGFWGESEESRGLLDESWGLEVELRGLEVELW